MTTPGARWRLPDGREGVQVAQSGRQIHIRVIDPASPAGIGPLVVAWVDRCTLLPCRYLGGAIPNRSTT